MSKLYAAERLVHRGITFYPGQSIECGDGEAADLVASKHWTQKRAVAMEARKHLIRQEYQPGNRRTSGTVRTG